jgi:hypothetical protein
MLVTSKMRYIFSKLGRTINYIEALQAGFKRYQLKIEMAKNTISATNNKLAPNLKKIIEQQQRRDSLNQTYNAPSLFKMDALEKTFKEKKEVTYDNFVPIEKKMFKSKVTSLNNESLFSQSS